MMTNSCIKQSEFTDIINKLSDIPLVSYEDSSIYRIHNAMPFDELMNEYKVASLALSAYHENDMERSIVVEYLSGVFQIICLVISERVSKFLKEGENKMFIVFRVVNNDFENKEILAMCSDLCIAEDILKKAVFDKSVTDNALYVIGTSADL